MAGGWVRLSGLPVPCGWRPPSAFAETGFLKTASSQYSRLPYRLTPASPATAGEFLFTENPIKF
jgi:hypothetical protein